MNLNQVSDGGGEGAGGLINPSMMSQQNNNAELGAFCAPQ